MNGLRETASVLIEKLNAIASTATVAIFPPYTYLGYAKTNLRHIAIGGQDCSTEKSGAYTGDVSADMLKDAGCDYVLAGHSERRMYHHETNATVKQKAERAIAAGLVPVICIGEDQKQREAGIYLDVITEQLERSIPENKTAHYMIAYEPVWAIGSGKIPSIEAIEEVHKTIASVINPATSIASQKRPILYGGSVKADNAGEILASPHIDGVLVGGASLDAEAFESIIKAVK